MRSYPKRASVVVIGGGIQGLSCAFNLALRGVGGVVVLDAGYWQGGASGRNGTLIRGGFASPEWTRFFGHSNRCWMNLAKTLGHNPMFTRRGYAMIGETQKTAAMLEGALKIHAENGVISRHLDGDGVREVLPAIAAERVTSAIHFRDGGVAPHHAPMKAYLAACRARGVQVHYRSKVTGIETSNGRASAVVVGDHRIDADAVLIAAGAFSPEMAKLAGVTLAGYPMRIEAMALEPTRPMIGPALALIDRLAYMHQTGRGEVVGGIEVPERPRPSLKTDLPVMTGTAKVYFEMFPALAQVRIMRHWGGMLHISPDYGPLLGPHPALRDLWITAGWSYGYSGAPGAGDLMGKAIATGQIDDRMAPFAVDRFDRGKPVRELGIVLATD